MPTARTQPISNQSWARSIRVGSPEEKRMQDHRKETPTCRSIIGRMDAELAGRMARRKRAEGGKTSKQQNAAGEQKTTIEAETRIIYARAHYDLLTSSANWRITSATFTICWWLDLCEFSIVLSLCMSGFGSQLLDSMLCSQWRYDLCKTWVARSLCL